MRLRTERQRRKQQKGTSEQRRAGEGSRVRVPLAPMARKKMLDSSGAADTLWIRRRSVARGKTKNRRQEILAKSTANQP